MASKAGSLVNAGAKIASTWGTAVQAAGSGKLVAEITHNLNVQELTPRAVGSGNYMITGSTKGNTKPVVTVKMDAGPRNLFDSFVAQFMGTDTPSAELTAGQGDYRHVLTFNTTLNAKYITVAYESSSATVHEFPTCAVKSVHLFTPGIPGYLQAEFEAVADSLQLSTAVNTNANLASATLTDTELFAVAFDDDFWINAQSGGALASGNQFNITNFDLKLERPQDSANELNGSTGANGSPIATDLFQGELTITVKELIDHSYYTIWSNETAQKCKFEVDGTQIGTGNNKSITCYIPRMQLIAPPEYGLDQNGVRPVTYKWKISKASSNPTGLNNTYPYFEIINTLSTTLLA